MSNVQGAADPWLGLELDSRYRLRKKLGEGGMGVVYKAEHILIEKPVAVKILRSEFAKSQDLVARFHQEARSASRIHHEHVVDITDFGKAPDGSAYFVMEYLEGYDLASLIEKGPTSYQRAIPIVGQVCSALHAAHEVGIVHRDLKPENIFLSSQHEHPDFVKILDFGIAKITQEGDQAKLTRPGMIFGTPEYMSPEQAGGGDLDRRVDIYALGIILFEMLTGEVPFRDPTFMGVLRKHLMEPVPSLREHGSHLPAELDEVLRRALAKNQNERFQTMIEFWQAIEAALPEAAQSRRVRFEGAANDSGRQRSISPPQGSRQGLPERNRFISPPPDASGQRRASPIPQAASAYRPAGGYSTGAPNTNRTSPPAAAAKPVYSGAYSTQKPKSNTAQPAKPMVSGGYQVQPAKPMVSGGYRVQPAKPQTSAPAVKPPPATLLLADAGTLAAYQHSNQPPSQESGEFDSIPTRMGENPLGEETLDLAGFEAKEHQKARQQVDFAAPVAKSNARPPEPTLDITQQPTRIASGLVQPEDLPSQESPSITEQPTRIASAASVLQPAAPAQAKPAPQSAPMPFSESNASPQPFADAPQPAAPVSTPKLNIENIQAEPATPESTNGSKRILIIAAVALGTLVIALLVYLLFFKNSGTTAVANPVPVKTEAPTPEPPREDPKSAPVQNETPKEPVTPVENVTPKTNTPTPVPANVEQDFPVKVKVIPAFAKIYLGSKEIGQANDTVTLRGKPGEKVKLTIKDEGGEYKPATVEITLGSMTETKMITLEQGAASNEKPTKEPKPKEPKPKDPKPKDPKPKQPKGGILNPFGN